MPRLQFTLLELRFRCSSRLKLVSFVDGEIFKERSKSLLTSQVLWHFCSSVEDYCFLYLRLSHSTAVIGSIDGLTRSPTSSRASLITWIMALTISSAEIVMRESNCVDIWESPTHVREKDFGTNNLSI